jgi:hypothetical protein
VPEGEKADLFHAGFLKESVETFDARVVQFRIACSMGFLTSATEARTG